MRKGNRNGELVHRTELGGRECGTGEDTEDRSRLKLKTLEQDIGQEILEQEDLWEIGVGMQALITGVALEYVA